jgi:beta-glucosidase/6-phospho-beta-glucosidase/beta-galactosidase
MKLLPTQLQTKQQLKGLGTSMLVGKTVTVIFHETSRFSFDTSLIFLYRKFRFLDPLLNGQYPKTMQDIVKERLPSFTPEQSKLVKGSVDYIGINQYTATYMADNPSLQQTPTSYSSDWHVQYICEL